MKANRIAPALALIVAACAAPPAPLPPPAAPPVRPVAGPVPPPPRPAPDNWRDAARSEGLWSWSMAGARSVARYGVAGAVPIATLTCDPAARAIILWRNGTATGEIPLVVTTTSTRKVLTARTESAGGASVTLAPRDPLLDAIAFSRGRFMLEIPGNPALYLPSQPELSRVIEDCR